MAQPPLGGAMHFQPGVPLRSICKGKGKGEGKGERKKEKKKGKGERRKEKRRTDTREGRDIHPPYFCGPRHLCQNVLPARTLALGFDVRTSLTL